jgi:hypothetical protein
MEMFTRDACKKYAARLMVENKKSARRVKRRLAAGEELEAVGMGGESRIS